MKKIYIKPESLLIQTEGLCTQNFNVASVIKGGTDNRTLDSTIPVIEGSDPNGRSNSDPDAWGSTGSNGVDLWGGD